MLGPSPAENLSPRWSPADRNAELGRPANQTAKWTSEERSDSSHARECKGHKVGLNARTAGVAASGSHRNMLSRSVCEREHAGLGSLKHPF